jgi:hypothetical protein
MTKHGLHDKLEKIFNIDESALQTEHTPSKIVHDKNVNLQCVTSNRSANITPMSNGWSIWLQCGDKTNKIMCLDSAHFRRSSEICDRWPSNITKVVIRMLIYNV